MLSFVMGGEMLAIKNLCVMRELMDRAYHPKLSELACWVAVRYSRFTITEVWREDGVHSLCRAIDLRSKNYEDPEAVAADINAHWIYDPQRPEYKCCVYHNVGKGWHFHLQVHDRTERRQ